MKRVCAAHFADIPREQPTLRRLYSPQLGNHDGALIMGRGILLWLIGVPIPIILLLALLGR
jgi:hypothetical protein